MLVVATQDTFTTLDRLDGIDSPRGRVSPTDTGDVSGD
jgi:hypothetical protein